MVTQGNDWTKRRLALELIARNIGLTECTVGDVESIVQTLAEIYLDSTNEAIENGKVKGFGDEFLRAMLLDEGANGRDQDDVNQTKMDV